MEITEFEEIFVFMERIKIVVIFVLLKLKVVLEDVMKLPGWLVLYSTTNLTVTITQWHTPRPSLRSSFKAPSSLKRGRWVFIYVPNFYLLQTRLD